MTKKASPKNGFLLIFFSMIMLSVATYFYFSTKSFLDIASKVQGKVIDLKEVRSSDSGVTYAPIFTYRDQKGQKHTIISSSSSKPASFEIGEEIEIFYDQKGPKGAKVNSFFSLWGFSTVFSGIAGIQFIIGIACIFVPQKGRNN